MMDHDTSRWKTKGETDFSLGNRAASAAFHAQNSLGSFRIFTQSRDVIVGRAFMPAACCQQALP
jgi:hypothetical protein